jgi:hypothetical protein
MLNQSRLNRFQSHLQKLDKPMEEKEKILYKLASENKITLGEFKALFSLIKVKEQNEN